MTLVSIWLSTPIPVRQSSMCTPNSRRSRFRLVAIPARRCRPVVDRRISCSWIAAIFLHAVTPPPQKRLTKYEGLTHVRSVGPERRLVGVQSRVSLHPFPTLTPRRHGPMVDHGEGRIPAMHHAVHGSRQGSSRATPRIPHVPIRG